MATVSLQIENTILKQKITHLTDLCEQHKSKYQQIKAQLQVQFDQAAEQYDILTNALKQQIENQNIKLYSMQNEFEHSKQKLKMKNEEHSSQIKSLQQQIKRHITKLNHIIEQNNIIQNNQIQHLEKEISQKDACIGTLIEKLNTLSEQYKPNVNKSANNSSSTLKMFKSLSIPRISPNATPIYSSPEIPTLTAQVNIIRKINTKYRKRENDTILNSKPPPIGVSNTQVSVWETPTDSEREASDEMYNDERTPNESDTFPLLLRQINANPYISPYAFIPTNNITIRMSETEISENAGTDIQS